MLVVGITIFLPLTIDRFGSSIAFFQYSPINFLSVRLPPPILEFCGPSQKSWIRKEATEVSKKLKQILFI